MVDAADLKSASRKRVGVRVPSWAPLFPPLPCFCCLQKCLQEFGIVPLNHPSIFSSHLHRVVIRMLLSENSIMRISCSHVAGVSDRM